MTAIIALFLSDFLTSAFSLLDLLLVNMLDNILHIETLLDGVFSSGMVTTLYQVVYGFSLSLLALKFLFKGFQIYILWRDGDADSSPQDMLIGAAQATVVTVCFPALYDVMASVTQWFSSHLMQAASLSGETDLSGLSSMLVGRGLVPSIIVTVYLVMAVVLYVKLVQRGVELLILRVALPIGCLGLLDSDYGIFKSFLQMFYKTMFTSVIQIVLLSLSMRVMTQFSFSTIALSIAILTTAFATPTLLQNMLIPVRQGAAMNKLYSGAQLTRMAAGFFKR